MTYFTVMLKDTVSPLMINHFIYHDDYIENGVHRINAGWLKWSISEVLYLWNWRKNFKRPIYDHPCWWTWVWVD